jgi:hypothetical protein
MANQSDSSSGALAQMSYTIFNTAWRPIPSRSSRSTQIGSSSDQVALISAPTLANRASSPLALSLCHSFSIASAGAVWPECAVILKVTVRRHYS